MDETNKTAETKFESDRDQAIRIVRKKSKTSLQKAMARVDKMTAEQIANLVRSN